ncbi:N-6 DNA methylase [Halopseudomonas nanhaiensis]|uniref:HsdM family class I SAM-dependent methyltransferase n=1 Tax=Halopseudomonas nanhaiensis TaxID=2830842 RepID=UPI001CBF9152|nr:N-6 DNA methylase [Halopseudomonas nanhaiensis]UAW99807.1 N-6 DNA methylase [Halopseudomonas nanhaiensis]
MAIDKIFEIFRTARMTVAEKDMVAEALLAILVLWQVRNHNIMDSRAEGSDLGFAPQSFRSIHDLDSMSGYAKVVDRCFGQPSLELREAILALSHRVHIDPIMENFFASVAEILLNTAEHPAGFDISELFDKFRASLAPQAGLDGIFQTPEDLAELMVYLVDPKPGDTIFDPVCGSGQLLLQAGKYLGKDGCDLGNASLSGWDRSRNLAKITSWTFLIHGLDPRSISCSDAFASREPYLKHDVVLANPPFSTADWDRDAFAKSEFAVFGVPPQSNADFAFLQVVIGSLKETGRGAVVVPSGMLFRKGTEGEIRKKIVSARLVDMIVALPTSAQKPRSISLYLLVIDKQKKDPSILFVDGTKACEEIVPQGHTLRALGECIRGVHGEDYQHSFPSRLVGHHEIEQNDFDLSVTRYLFSEKGERRDLNIIYTEYAQVNHDLDRLQKELESYLAAELDDGR